MPRAQYEIGDRVTISTTFTDDDDTLTSPATVVGEYRKPSGTVAVSLSPGEVSTGVFEMTLPTFDEAGLWKWYIAGTAGLIAADQGTIIVAAKVTA